MNRNIRFGLFAAMIALVILTFTVTSRGLLAANDDSGPSRLVLVVMDPLSAPLACDCVQGYAQRKYEFLGEFLQHKLRQPVQVVWAESLSAALKETGGKADLVIGKHSVVLSDAANLSLKMKPVAQLTGKDDSVMQSGLFVVRKDDPAKSVADLRGYRIFFGPADCDEKSAAPIALLKQHGIPVPDPLETAAACSTAAAQLMELPAETKAAAVISSYAQPLLEGCGTIQKGDLRVIAESRPVPFITAFVNTATPPRTTESLTAALMEAGLNAELLIHLETGLGFEPWKDPPLAAATPVKASSKVLIEESKKKD